MKRGKGRDKGHKAPYSMPLVKVGLILQSGRSQEFMRFSDGATHVQWAAVVRVKDSVLSH